MITTLDADGIRELEVRNYRVKVVYLNIPENERKKRMLSRGDKVCEVELRLINDRKAADDFNFTSTIYEVRRGKVEQIVESILKLSTMP